MTTQFQGQDSDCMVAVDAIGHFRSIESSHDWRLDESALLLHGLRVATHRTTTEQLLAAVHPDDQARVQHVLERAAAGGPFSVAYRVEAGALVRSLLLVGRTEAPLQASPVTEGYIVDLTDDLMAAEQRAARVAVSGALLGRDWIEQAKGTLMLSHGLSPDQAFALLRWWSRRRGVKVKVLARRMTATVQGGAFSNHQLRRAIDNVLDDLSAAGGAGPALD